MKYHLLFQSSDVNLTIPLPASKSISNRLLIIRNLCTHPFKIHNLSTSDDTINLQNCLNADEICNVDGAGTAMRFLTAYFSTIKGTKILTGNNRMKQRPIGGLVNALRQLGANISYIENENYPPLKISGKQLLGGAITIDGSVSSQFVSALLLIAPTLKNGLTLTINGTIVSFPYIQLTLNLMKQFGISYSQIKNTITVEPQEYKPTDIFVEPDWTAASYWYEIVALSNRATIFLQGLSKKSIQGDSILYKLFEKIGVHTEFVNTSAKLTKQTINISDFKFNFINNPDLVKTFAVTLSALQIPYIFNGLQTLRIKETDRINALYTELKKIGIDIIIEDNKIIYKKNHTTLNTHNILINTYNDHRIALSFAPLVFKTGSIILNHGNVINKSYPNFWNDLEKAGVIINKHY